MDLRPQPGPQEMFLASPADIVIYGGAAGGGKSWAILLEALRHVIRNKEFSAVYFRRNAVQVKNPGGLWDESMKLYPLAGGVPVSNILEWQFREGGKVKFAHLENDSTVLNWQGSQIPLICFDELTHFSENQFWYMLSRNRSMCGVRPYIRATTNPDADSWVAKMISWWINQGTGYPIPERSGIVRWFARINDEIVWGDSAAAIIDKYGDQTKPKSFTFIPATIQDNKKLIEADPGYMANLLALDSVQRERLLGGNWKVRQATGGMFLELWLKYADIKPATLNVYIMVDPASSKKKSSYNTAMAVIGVDAAKNKYLLDGYNHKMNLRERWLALRGLRRKWKGATGVQGVFVGYERYGMQSDMEYFQEQMELDRDVFEIKELNWSLSSGQSKRDRVQRLVPDFVQGRFYLPLATAAGNETSNQARMREIEQPYRIFSVPKYKDHLGNLYSMLDRFINEFLNFPSPNYPDDLIDACSRIYDMEYDAPVLMTQEMYAMLEPEVE